MTVFVKLLEVLGNTAPRNRVYIICGYFREWDQYKTVIQHIASRHPHRWIVVNKPVIEQQIDIKWPGDEFGTATFPAGLVMNFLKRLKYFRCRQIRFAR